MHSVTGKDDDLPFLRSMAAWFFEKLGSLAEEVDSRRVH
jgi:hypothetical protein